LKFGFGLPTPSIDIILRSALCTMGFLARSASL
jgi:hypothetical protein